MGSTRDARFGLSDGNTGNWNLLEAFVRESADSADMDLINCRALRALLSMKMDDYFVAFHISVVIISLLRI